MWAATKLFGPPEQDHDVCAPSAGSMADDEAAGLQDNQFFQNKEPRRPKSIILHGNSHKAKYWDTCFPATPAVSIRAEGSGEVDVPNEAAMDTVSGTVSEGGNGDRGFASSWLPKHSASRYDMDVGQLELAGVSGDATGSINDGPAPTTAGGTYPDPVDKGSADGTASHTDSDSLTSQTTDGYSAAQSDVKVDSEAGAATLAYGIWMRLALGPLPPGGGTTATTSS